MSGYDDWLEDREGLNKPHECSCGVKFHDTEFWCVVCEQGFCSQDCADNCADNHDVVDYLKRIKKLLNDREHAE